jgi:hypothetical protein
VWQSREKIDPAIRIDVNGEIRFSSIASRDETLYRHKPFGENLTGSLQ